MCRFLLVTMVALSFATALCAQQKTAPAPLFRDPITDGAADPVLIWNHVEKSWWMLYTQRRANAEVEDVAYCYATPIGIASSDDNGQSWIYRGTLDLKIDNGVNTFWAPDIVYSDGVYHLFVAYIKGARTHWGGDAHIVHFTSSDMWSWEYKGTPELSSSSVIDATLLKTEEGVWKMWYKDQGRGSVTMMAQSNDLCNWSYEDRPAIGGGAHEGAKVFKFQGYYWMLTDEWVGMRVYRSDDLVNWQKQGLVLDGPSNRTDDKPSGAHGDVVVFGDKAYLFYFTHPGRNKHIDHPNNADSNILPFDQRRSSIQVAPLIFNGESLEAPRDREFDFYMPAQ